MPSALTPIKQMYYFRNGAHRDVALTEVQFLEDRIRINVNQLETTLPAEALQDFHSLELRWTLVNSVHKKLQFKMCYTTPGTKKTPATDVVLTVAPTRLAWAETKLTKGKTWVLTAIVDGVEQEFLVANIRGVWDPAPAQVAEQPTEAAV